MATVKPPQIVMIKVDNNLSPLCIYCGISFNFNCDLAAHIAASHFENVFHCVVCDSVRYETKDLFVKHIKTHPPITFTEDENLFSTLPVLVELNEPLDCISYEKKNSNVLQSQTSENKSKSQFDLKGCITSMTIQNQNILNPKQTKIVFRHPCNVCGRTFTRLYDLKRHFKKMHQLHEDILNVCEQAEVEQNVINSEEKTMKATFLCTVCNYEFTRKFDLKRHMQTIHALVIDSNINNLSATFIPMLETNTNDLQSYSSHVADKMNNQPHNRGISRLPISSRLKNSSSALKSRLLDKPVLPRQQEYSCFVCKKIFTNIQAKVSHGEAHTAEEQAQASAEKTRLSEETELIKKAEEVINGRICYRCAQCNRLVMHRNGFIEHWRIHSGVKPYTCHVCGKQFRVLNLLTRHIQDVHDGIKRYPCDICGRKFANSSARDDHRRIHTGERPFVCHICGKAFKSKSCLFVHNRFHSNNRPYKCTFCEKRYRTRQQLKEHVTLHTGEKPNICNLCGKAFRLNSVLRRHKHNHDRKEQVACQICGKLFPQLRYLTLHARSHNRICIDNNTT